MMFNVVHPSMEVLAREGCSHQFRNASSSAPILQAAQHESEVRPLRYNIGQLPKEIGPAVLIDRDVLNIGKLETRFPQAVGNCLRREARTMLHAAEPLLFRRRDEFPVAHERSGRISMEGVEAEDDHAVIFNQEEVVGDGIIAPTARNMIRDRPAPAMGCPVRICSAECTGLHICRYPYMGLERSHPRAELARPAPDRP